MSEVASKIIIPKIACMGLIFSLQGLVRLIEYLWTWNTGLDEIWNINSIAIYDDEIPWQLLAQPFSLDREAEHEPVW